MRVTYTIELLNKFCSDNNIELLHDYSNEKIWCEMTLEGKCINTDCTNNFKKMFKHLLNHNGYCKQCLKGKNSSINVYNWKLLKSYCDEKKITLNKDYSKEKLGSKIRIHGICENTECVNDFDCVFRNLIEFGALCNSCFYKKRNDITKISNKEKYGVEFVSQVKEFKKKAEETMMEKYGVKYTTQSTELMDKMKSNNMTKYGVEHVMQSNDFKQKVKDTNKEKYGVECSLQREDIKEKSKETCLEKYGVEFASQSKAIQEKTKETCLEKYGVEHYFQSSDKKEKSKETCLEKYGVEFISQSKEIQKKKEETCFNNHGVKSPFQMEETKQKNRLVMIENKDDIMEKRKNTCLEKYGVEHHTQNPEIMEKCSKSAFKPKNYTLPSGKIIKIQGYENYALDELLLKDKVLEEDIINGCSSVPEIWYYDEEGKKHRHYVDVFIPSQNRMIEVKSTWTAEKKKDCIFLKQNAGKLLGYNYEIWVYDKKGKKVECYK